jgi:hypothetical protein
MQSIELRIENDIESQVKGTLFFGDSFTNFGSSEAIRKALQRLEEKGFITRIAQGIYVRPIISDYIGEVLPSAEKVAMCIAKRDRAKIVPTGVYALNALGLSTQVPMNLVYLTDGAPRVIKIGKRTINFKRTTPKNLLAKGDISSLAIQALRAIGSDQITDDEESKIIELLKKEDRSNLLHDMQLAPVWIKKIIQKSLK